MQRSGTNFLYDLLRLHPECEAGGVIWEDFLIAHSDLLVSYAKAVCENWQPQWNVEEIMGPTDDLICQHLGKGLISFLNSQAAQKRLTQVPSTTIDSEHSLDSFQKRLITKTPSVKNLRHFFKIFPHVHLLILIRDGRAVIESGVKSFNWNYEKKMHVWADSAHTILQFDQDVLNANHKYLIVRYEDIFRDTEKELKKILLFLGLDVERYDFDAAMNLPVKGSSELHKQGSQHLHWKPVEKSTTFNPILRWNHWGRAKHERFNWLAGDYLEQFGYTRQALSKNRSLWIIWNYAMDIKWAVKTSLVWLKRWVLRRG